MINDEVWLPKAVRDRITAWRRKGERAKALRDSQDDGWREIEEGLLRIEIEEKLVTFRRAA